MVVDLIALILSKVKIPFTSPKGVIDQMKIGKIIAILCIAALFGCRIYRNRDVPEELWGLWETSVPQYENCSFTFEGKIAMFQNRLALVGIYFITDIEKSIKDGKTLYDIHYKDEHGKEYRLSLYYLKINHNDLIRFKNQEVISWFKREVQQEE